MISGLGSSFPVSTQAEDTQAKLSWASSPTAWEPGHCFPESVCPLVLGRCPSGAPRAGRQKGLPEPLPIRAGRMQGRVFLAELQDRQTRDWLRLQATRVAPAPWAPRPSCGEQGSGPCLPTPQGGRARLGQLTAFQQTSRPRTMTPWPSPSRPPRSRTSAPQAVCSPPWRRDVAGSASTGLGGRGAQENARPKKASTTIPQPAPGKAPQHFLRLLGATCCSLPTNPEHQLNGTSQHPTHCGCR